MNYTPEFMLFWRKYPGRYHEAGRSRADGGYEHYWKENKRKAMQWWKKLTAYQKKWAMYSVMFMKRGKYVPDAFRWLRDGKYEDIDMPEDRPTMPTEFIPDMKRVPNKDNRSTSDKVNQQLKALKG